MTAVGPGFPRRGAAYTLTVMPQVIVRFFGPARDIVGQSELRQDVAEGETVGAVAGRLAEAFPRLGAALGLRLAVNKSYVPMNHVLHDGDEVAVIPPVSGGSSEPRVRLTREPIDVGAIAADLVRPEAGAVATFLGVVRAERSDRGPLTALDYAAYDDMALSQMDAIRRRALSQFDVLDAAVVHRLGRMTIGEASIAVVVVAGHRAAAFSACQWIVDAVKVDVPIWKKNVWADGAADWVDPTCS